MGNIRLVQALLHAGANIDETDARGATALANAARGGHLQVVQVLLEEDADVHVADADVQTALMHAAAGGFEQTVAALLDKGANVQLGPGMCLARVPTCGRNFEYVSGEDPMLGKILVAQAVAGIQSTGVIANAKHW